MQISSSKQFCMSTVQHLYYAPRFIKGNTGPISFLIAWQSLCDTLLFWELIILPKEKLLLKYLFVEEKVRFAEY